MRTGNRENACSKFTYTTEKEARVVLYKCKNSSSRSKIAKRAYYCKECGGWHTTSLKNKTK